MLNDNISKTPSNINAPGFQLSKLFPDGKQSKYSIAILPGRQAIQMLNSNISKSLSNINAFGRHLRNNFRTASNTNAQSQ